tara:strand:- start:734 stop:1021 length:288 start_codon:yes stop_codon:yes gene_type:complete
MIHNYPPDTGGRIATSSSSTTDVLKSACFPFTQILQFGKRVEKVSPNWLLAVFTTSPTVFPGITVFPVPAATRIEAKSLNTAIHSVYERFTFSEI